MTDHTDIDMFQGTDHEEFTYAVTANLKDKSSTAANQAAARIDALMRTLPNPTGYTLMLARRSKRIAMTAPDDSNLDDLWQQRGGLYDVHVEPVRVEGGPHGKTTRQKRRRDDGPDRRRRPMSRLPR